MYIFMTDFYSHENEAWLNTVASKQILFYFSTIMSLYYSESEG